MGLGGGAGHGPGQRGAATGLEAQGGLGRPHPPVLRLGARDAAVCRELTKLHEEVRRDTLPVLADDYAQGAETRGEFVIVIAPPLEQPGIVGEDQIDDMLRSALASASLKDAVEAVTAASGQPRRLVYQRALALAKERGDGRD